MIKAEIGFLLSVPVKGHEISRQLFQGFNAVFFAAVPMTAKKLVLTGLSYDVVPNSFYSVLLQFVFFPPLVSTLATQLFELDRFCQEFFRSFFSLCYSCGNVSPDGVLYALLKDLTTFRYENQHTVPTVSFQHHLSISFGSQALGGEGCQWPTMEEHVIGYYICYY